MREDADGKYFGPFLALSRCVPAPSPHNKEKKSHCGVSKQSFSRLYVVQCGSVAMATRQGFRRAESVTKEVKKLRRVACVRPKSKAERLPA